MACVSADDVGTEQRRRGAGRSELLRLCREGSKQRWLIEQAVLPRRWRYVGAQRTWGFHPLPAAANTTACSARCSAVSASAEFGRQWQSSRQLSEVEGQEGLLVGTSMGPGFATRLAPSGREDLLHHMEVCPAAKQARQWWLEHWERLQQPLHVELQPSRPLHAIASGGGSSGRSHVSVAPGGRGFLWCFGKPTSNEANILRPDLKHPDHRRAQRLGAINQGRGKFGTIEWCIHCRKSGSHKCFCPVVGGRATAGLGSTASELKVGGPPPPWLGLPPPAAAAKTLPLKGL